MVTYDDAPEIRALYAKYPLYGTKLNYSAQVKRLGTELLVLDPKLAPPDSIKPLLISSDELKAA
jgi:DNA adenine methylase